MLKFSGSSYLIGGPMFNFRFYLRTNYLNTTKKLSHNTEVSHYSMSFITNYLASSPNLNILMRSKTHQNAKLRTHSLTQSSQLPPYTINTQWSLVKQHYGRVVRTDTPTGMLPGIPGSATCVQKFDDSLNSAIRITYRISLRSSSLREPRDPLLAVLIRLIKLSN